MGISLRVAVDLSIERETQIQQSRQIEYQMH